MFGLLRQEPDAALGSSLEIVDTDIKPLRRVRACTACRNRKLKCSLARPQCNRCDAQKITCHYPEAGESSKKDSFIGVETTPDQPKDSASTSDEASLKRKRVKKAHLSADQRKHAEKTSQKDKAEHGTVVKKEKSRASKTSAGSHQLSIHPPPTPISPTITAEDPEESQNMMNDGAWINHLLLYTPGEGLETCVDTMDMMGMASPWLDFTTEGLGGASGTDKNGVMSDFTSAPARHHSKPMSPAESTNSNINPLDDTVDLDNYFTDSTNSPDMLLQSPAYTDLLLSSITGTFPGNENWTWDQHAMNNLDLLTPMSSVSPFQTTVAPHNTSSNSSSSDSPSCSTWSHSCGSESTGVTSAGSPSFLFANNTNTGETTYPITHSTKNSHTSSSKSSKHRDHAHRSKTPASSKSTSAPRNTSQGHGCYEAHITPLHQALERLQISSFAFLQAKAARRSRHEHSKSKGKHSTKHKHKESSPPYDTLLKSQKGALVACGALLDCPGCGSRSDLVMLVISVCGLLVGSMEGLGVHATTVRRNSGAAGDVITEGHDHTGQNEGEGMWMYEDNGHGNSEYSGGQWAGATEQDMDMDEEDTAQIIRTLTASRIAKLKGILETVVHVVSARSELAEMGAEEDWSAHVGLAHLLRGKLRRYSGAV